MEDSTASKVSQNKAAKTVNEDGNDVDLGSVFQNLCVGSKWKKRQKKLKSRRSTGMFSKPKVVVQDDSRSMKKSMSAPILRAPRLLITKNRTNHKDTAGTTSTVTNGDCVDLKITEETSYLANQVKSCGSQHQAAGSCSPSELSKNTPMLDDTTPDELAAYFEQLLHIPKPMSSMAEMMYA